jgi:hypothetical protein
MSIEINFLLTAGCACFGKIPKSEILKPSTGKLTRELVWVREDVNPAIALMQLPAVDGQ